MSCKTICQLCDKLIISSAVTYAGGTLTVNIPAGSYRNGEKYCLVIAQAIPNTAIVNAPVVVTVGDGTTNYPLIDWMCRPVLASQLRTRTRYSTRVVTTPNTGSFRVLGRLCGTCGTDLAAIGS